MKYFDTEQKQAHDTAISLWARDDGDTPLEEYQLQQERKLQKLWLNETPHNDIKIEEKIWKEMKRD
jgi:hypothetical protein